ncbi:MAG TPA: PRC-barrel domain-containing protein [Pilimelia sp.]|nr:PRC-barrel domain-containing protein [Pilimelia sp.]
MAEKITATLVKLSDSDKMLADPAADIRGRVVRDRDGEEVGKVDDLLIDPEEGKVRLLRVAHGGVLGFGATPSFIPVEAVVRITDDAVHINESRSRVSEAPGYDPELVEESEFYDSLYGYYGYAPFWGPGYVYPGFPYYR